MVIIPCLSVFSPPEERVLLFKRESTSVLERGVGSLVYSTQNIYP
jgi:hypothetical protein